MRRLVEDIFNTRDDEIQCEEARVLIARCTQALLTADEARRQYPALYHHFRFCPDCAEEYRLAMELARQEEGGQLHRPSHIPPAPARERSSVWAGMAKAVVAAFPGFPPLLSAAGAPVRGGDAIAEPVDVILGDSGLRVTFDVAVNERDDDLRDLFCTILSAGQAPCVAFEGSPVWLLLGDAGPPVAEGVLDELGDVVFLRMPPGLYALRFNLAGQAYVVTDIVLP
jgi:hypothetical protein